MSSSEPGPNAAPSESNMAASASGRYPAGPDAPDTPTEPSQTVPGDAPNVIDPITADSNAQLPPITHSSVNQPSAYASELARTLIEAKLTIAVAESLTGGGLAAELVRVPGISASFLGGIVAYQDEIKHSLLAVSTQLLFDHGAVHPEVAEQMARGVRERFIMSDRHADIGVSTTGVAGPGPTDGHPAGTVYVGISSLWGEHVAKLDFGNLVREDDPVGSRQRIRFATIEAALFNVLEHLAIQAEI